MDGGAFGAGKAGGAFDPQAFIRQPQTILRFVSWSGGFFPLSSKHCRILAFQRCQCQGVEHGSELMPVVRKTQREGDIS
ncbi:hypothetical protein Nmel_005381 [Mimus melanotis]